MTNVHHYVELSLWRTVAGVRYHPRYVLMASLLANLTWAMQFAMQGLYTPIRHAAAFGGHLLLTRGRARFANLIGVHGEPPGRLKSSKLEAYTSSMVRWVYSILEARTQC